MLSRALKNSPTHPHSPPLKAPPKPHQASISLSDARCGERLRVVGVRPGSKSFVRLKELGFCESAVVSKVTSGRALICQLYGVRMAIARDLGADVMVERIAP